MHTHTYICTRTHMHTHTHVYTCTLMHTHTYAHKHMHTHMHTHMHARTHTRMLTRTHTRPHAHIHTYMCMAATIRRTLASRPFRLPLSTLRPKQCDRQPALGSRKRWECLNKGSSVGWPGVCVCACACVCVCTGFLVAPSRSLRGGVTFADGNGPLLPFFVYTLCGDGTYTQHERTCKCLCSILFARSFLSQ